MPGANRELFHKAHYQVIAKRIREARASFNSPDRTSEIEIAGFVGVNMALDMVSKDLADWFSEDNPRFERDTWMEATNTNESA